MNNKSFNRNARALRCMMFRFGRVVAVVAGEERGETHQPVRLFFGACKKRENRTRNEMENYNAPSVC